MNTDEGAEIIGRVGGSGFVFVSIRVHLWLKNQFFRFSTTRMPPIDMALSTALHMS
jgi:hypothetical protein